MNILEIIPIMDPNNLWTGPHRVVFDVSKALARKGHNVTVCTSDMSDIKTRIATISETSLEGFKIVRLKNVNKYLSNAIGLVITPELNNFLSSNIQDYDIVHCHEYTTFENIFLHHYAKKYDIPYVIQAHGSILRIGKKARKLFYDVIFGQNILRDATKVIALTRMEAQQYRDMSVNENKIAIISNGIDLTEYSDLPPKGTFKKKYNIQHKPKMILFLGRLHRTKGIDLLIKAYAHLIKTDNQHNTVLVIAGPDDGFLIEAISLVNSLSLSHLVLFTGFINDKDKRAALVDAEIFVTPSFYGFPLTFLEACAVGIPIVTTTLGDQLDWIENNVGYVTRPKVSDLSNAMSKILLNDSLHNQFSKNCLLAVQSAFRIETVVDKLEALYVQARK